MKTILYNPIFINPQAYYVFPRLTRYLQPDNESTAEPANYIGTIEVKVIAYGDTTLKRTYTNTDSIDLSEFKNTWIRISLFTKVGSCVLGEWKIGNMESDLPYIDPEVLASLKAVVIVGNKTNNDSDRAIVKNLVDPDNPFVISNAAYTEGSGYADKGSPYYGAFVIDGIDDLITSTKTVQEMLGGSNEITVVSMMANLDSRKILCNSNYSNTNGYNVRNTLEPNGVITMLGYTDKNGTTNNLNLIMGDKNSIKLVDKVNFNSDYVFYPAQYYKTYYQVAWYWTIIANKVLTTDQINQVIAYFNLDRTLKSDIYCNIAKQGITNENHAEFGDKLIDFSGNGRDIQLNNIAWKGDSGIGKYETELSNTSIWTQSKETTSSPFSSSYNGLSGWIIFANTELTNSADMPSFKIQVKGLLEGQELIYRYYDSNGQSNVYSMGKDGEYTLPSDVRTAKPQTSNTSGFQVVKNETNIITITQIPSHVGALYLDGVSDFGKVTGMPIYKDYTFIIDRQIISIGDTAGVVASKFEDSTDVNKQGAFLFEYLGAPNNISAWSFYKDNGKVANTDFTRGISYQSTYSYNGKDLTIGTSKDSDKLWLGTIRDNDRRFFNGAIYSLMSFPYSMSEFLIERQLKKHKLGTLYPDMVEFRPVIKANDNYKIFYTAMLPLTGDIWERINIGDYVPVGRRIAIQMSFDNEAKKLVSAVSSQLGNITIVKNSNNIGYTIFGDVLKDKSPQKISITIEQDENYVLFNPVITSNVEYHKLDFYLNNYQKRINIGDYIPKGAYLRANFYLKNNVDELTVFTFNGVNIGYRRSSVDDTAFNIGHIYNYDSPQEVNITIDEYIRYEEIVQPYPVLLRFNDENGNEVSWGGKFRVGSTITRIGSAADSNLLPNIYNIFGLLLNNNQVTSSKVIVEKTMVFKAKSAYIFDNNEPKCILSPSRLRIPNSSYKLLGYIPDISGHGNHGKINNSAYAGMSGVNGYPVVFGANKTWANESNGYVTSITSNTIHITNVLNAGLALLYSYVKYNGNLQNIKEIPPFKIEIKGLEGRSKFIYKYLATSDATKETNLYLGNGTHELPKSFLPTEALINDAVIGFSISPIEEGVTNFLSDITIKVLPEYEGAYCLDGVDDFVTIPTTVGGKQVLMKVNWDKTIADAILYDQRGYPNEFAIYNADVDNNNNPVFAYQARNNGQTYIDGILNKNIKASELRAITHNITITNELSTGTNTSSPVIGSNRVRDAYFTKMALYDFMLFDNISTDDKIKELNEYVGIEAKVELPPYYWDAYGKTNLDEDKATIQQRGVAIGDYDLINNNFAYEGMSGYNGYPAVFGTNKTYANLVPNDGNFILTSSHNIINVTKFDTSYGLLYSHIKLDGKLTSRNIDYPSYKIKVTGLGENFGLHYSYLESSSDTTVKGFEINNDGIYIIPKSFASDGSLTSNSDWIGFIFTGTAPKSCNVTIEVLPEYENGLVYDGVTDYSENANIPAFTDYTYIFKRTLLNKKYNSASVFKGSNQQSGGGAFICDYNSVEPELMIQGYSFGAGLYANSLNTNDIVYGTKNSVNGAIIAPGNNADVEGLAVGKWRAYRQMVFYKLILYPKTIPLLQINFLKNLMERDEIIDLTNPIFIQE